MIIKGDFDVRQAALIKARESLSGPFHPSDGWPFEY